MKYLLFILFILAYGLTTFGQNATVQDSLSYVRSQPDSVKLPTTALDSTIQSLQEKLNASDAPDSVKNKLQQQLNQLNQQHLANQKLDSLQNLYQKRADSLQALNLPHQKYLDKVDSLTQLPERKINEKLTQWQQNANKKLEVFKGKLDGDITEKLPGDKALPGVEGVDLPAEGLTDDLGADLIPEQLSTDINTEELTNLQQELNIENPIDGELLEDSPVGDLQKEAGDISQGAKGMLEDFNEEANINEITAQVDEYGNQVGEVADELSAAKNGDLSGVEDRASEEVVKEFDDLGSLDENKALLEKTKAEHEEYLQMQKEYLEKVQQYSDPEFVKQRISEKSKYIANTKLKEYTSKVEEAREELAQVKLDSPKALIEVPNAQEWPIRDRFIAGANLELFRREGTQLDFAPYAGFQLTHRIHLYGSYLYRIDFNTDDPQVNFGNRVYGPRVATTYCFFKGFYVRIAADQIRTYVPNSSIPDEQNRDWVRSFYAGLGNRYNISRHVKGTIQVMYNFSYDRNTPFPNRYNIRMGFEVDFRKRVTRKDVIDGLKKAQKKKRMLESIKKKVGD
ncbi:MAG: hypothetical protein AAGF85_17265 [Bacteroidota bacterium]